MLVHNSQSTWKKMLLSSMSNIEMKLSGLVYKTVLSFLIYAEIHPFITYQHSTHKEWDTMRLTRKWDKKPWDTLIATQTLGFFSAFGGRDITRAKHQHVPSHEAVLQPSLWWVPTVGKSFVVFIRCGSPSLQGHNYMWTVKAQVLEPPWLGNCPWCSEVSFMAWQVAFQACE